MTEESPQCKDCHIPMNPGYVCLPMEPHMAIRYRCPRCRETEDDQITRNN